ncbi:MULTISPECIES: TetR/AcrR family transcriptional regulator [unclassified Thauera]|uniref:TetR/AcrR family transcriptional regulator n=1 Tax=unclassified Thauera TaxID=2609274 RepID=UPI0002D0A4AD|nr:MULTISPECIES: TetR/AcrR family transcriptional regulator [unclassified Thauera]ENO76074.1 TetR family transcriptional regulator [Thauera sp. 27]ENO91915.1 TetR family transcriptional regulator [Thauera sp. 28]
MPTSSSTTDHTRAEARRQQILCAAAQCFREHGFHGASIAQISKSAGMSAGHIYHYFDNKEAIIAAIVAQDLEGLLKLSAELRAAGDIGQALIERAAEGVADQLDPATAGLKLEIAAEAARNPRVAEIVREADLACRRSLAATLRAIRSAAGHDDDDAKIEGMVEVLATLFEGLLLRSIRNPELDRGRLVSGIQGAIRSLIEQA